MAETELMRTSLYAGGTSPVKIIQAGFYNEDCLVYDLEDSVSAGEKDAARFLVCNAIKYQRPKDKYIVVRVNGIYSRELDEDLEAVVRAQPDAIRIPKVEYASEVAGIDQKITAIETKAGLPLGKIKIWCNIESYLGVLNARDFLVDWAAQGNKTVRELMRPAYLVPETLDADDLLQDMQRKKIHLAVVLDEYGELAGVITVEDLLEEIVGNIYDEFDPAEPKELEKLEDNLWRVSGSLSTEDLAEALDMELPEDEDYDTVGGMILSCLRTIPEDGSQPTVQVNGLELKAEQISDHRIRSVLVRKLPQEDPEQEEP